MKRIFLWTCPRSLSTAFYTSISTLARTKCIFEPLTLVAIFGPDEERKWSWYEPGFLPEEISVQPTYESTKEAILQNYPDTDLLFVKEFPFSLHDKQIHEILTLPDFDDFTHTFLIRDPKRSVFSHYKVKEANGDFENNKEIDTTEFGYQELYRLYCKVKEKLCSPPVVIDAADLQTQPDMTMKAYCEAVGIQFELHMTSWEPKSFFHSRFWTAWFAGYSKSTGFVKKLKEVPLPLEELPQRVVNYIDKCCPLYEEMRANRLIMSSEQEGLNKLLI